MLAELQTHKFPNEIKTVVIDRITHTPVAVNAMLGESDSLLLLYRIPD